MNARTLALKIPLTLNDLSPFFPLSALTAHQKTEFNTLYQHYRTACQQLSQALALNCFDSAYLSRWSFAKDRRFADVNWHTPYFAFLAEGYLVNSRYLMKIVDLFDTGSRQCKRWRWQFEQWIMAAAPSNFFFSNPEAQRLCWQTQGYSMLKGMRQFYQDLFKGKISQSDPHAFAVGKNLATTPGMVIYENACMQLIHYQPQTRTVFSCPLLIVPPFINKFYILDLQPDNSLVRYALEQGHQVFLISWNNPDLSLAHLSWESYLRCGVLSALTIVQALIPQQKINTLGFCIGGTLLSCAAALLIQQKQFLINSLTLLTTPVDFRDNGIFDLMIDEQQVSNQEQAIGGAKGKPYGLMSAQELACVFAFLRPNELVWPYVVGNYLKGETPSPFDFLHWNNDGVNLPGALFAWILRHLYLQNDLIEPKKLTLCGVPIELSALNLPIYLYASQEDHIVTWRSVYRSLKLFNNNQHPVRFVLGASGHVAGVINSPHANKRCYWLNLECATTASAQQWRVGAQQHPGSWWSDWIAWLKSYAGEKIAAPKTLGNHEYPPIEGAPGRYVYR